MKEHLQTISAALVRAQVALEIAQDNGQDVTLTLIKIRQAIEAVSAIESRELTPSAPNWENTDISRLARQSALESHFYAKADYFVD